MRRFWLTLVGAWLLPALALAQPGKPTGQTPPPAGQLVELLPGAGLLVGDTLRGEKIRKVKRDSANNTQVNFKQGPTLMWCDSATQFLKRNLVDAFGHIRLMDEDGTTVVADTLYYDGNTRIARLRGQVILTDVEKTVTTRRLDYNLKTKIAHYYGGGTVRNDSSTLNSQVGYYNTVSKVATFRKNVVYQSPNNYIEADTLTYFTREKLAKFNSRTRIRTPNGLVIADGGEYNETLGTSKFKGRAKIDTKDYTISGDFLDYDKITEKGVARKNVEFYGKKDNITVLGDYAKHDGVIERTEVYGNAVLISPPSYGTDTLFISADTLISYQEKSGVDSLPDRDYLIGYRNVRAYRSDFQSKSDSIGYFLNDSTIHFAYDPVIWSKGSQMTAQKIDVRMKNGQIEDMKLNEKSFVISTDTVKNFNQTKGREIKAFFRKGQLYRTDVDGNGESLYYVLEQDTLVTGINYIKCAKMKISFNDSSRLSEIMFYQQPDAKLIPPHEIKESDTRLDAFTWRIDEQPAKGEVLGIHASNQYRSGEIQGGRLVVQDQFLVFHKGGNLLFYKADAKDEDLKPAFVVQVFPKDKNDIPIELRKAGYTDLGFQWPAEARRGRVALHSLPLPEHKLLKIVVGQKDAKGKMLWQKTYFVK